MFGICSKPREHITPADVTDLVAAQAREYEKLEFKSSLPAKKGSTDPWIRGKANIGDYAKRKLLDESIAFANAYGGVLVIGVNDTNGYACGISLLPRCKDLSDNLRLVFRDCVDPHLPHVEIFGVETDGDAGVVIIRVPKSHRAPHRNKTTLRCTIRRLDRCEPMTMHEIQDMTINLSRSRQRVDDELAKRSSDFESLVNRFFVSHSAYGIRLTAIPITDEIRIDRLLQGHDLNARFKPPTFLVMRHIDDQDRPATGINEVYKPCFSAWKPKLRAVRSEYMRRSWFGHTIYAAMMYKEIHAHGLIELGFISVNSLIDTLGFTRPQRLHREIPVVEFATLAVWADQVRTAADTPLAEFFIEVELIANHTRCPIHDATKSGKPILGKLERGTTCFPRYPLRDTEQLPQLLEFFERDFLNACGAELADLQGNLTISKHHTP